MIRALTLALAIATTTAGAAEACMRPIAGPGERMARRYLTVAVVRIDSVQSFNTERPQANWEAQTRWVRRVEGYDQSVPLRIRHREQTECPRVLPLPRKGELWAVYLEADYTRSPTAVHEAWPLAWAERLDPRFGGSPDAPPPPGAE